jgi:hypothetical protein
LVFSVEDFDIRNLSRVSHNDFLLNFFAQKGLEIVWVPKNRGGNSFVEAHTGWESLVEENDGSMELNGIGRSGSRFEILDLSYLGGLATMVRSFCSKGV